MIWLTRFLRRNRTNSPRESMIDLRRSDPCWCGSRRRYGVCHRKEDRRRMRELGINMVQLRNNPFLCKPPEKDEITSCRL